jgi:hypothetical protein
MNYRNLTRELPIEESPAPRFPPPPADEETLVIDARAGLTPSQMVDLKLDSLLRNPPLVASHPAE